MFNIHKVRRIRNRTFFDNIIKLAANKNEKSSLSKCQCQTPKSCRRSRAVMNRDFVYDLPQGPSAWSRVASTLNRWLWGALCCGVPGIPCYFCTCCEKLDDTDRDRPRVNRMYSAIVESTATTERVARPHRPHAPRGRKSTPEMLSAVRCALTQLQGDTAPPLPVTQKSVDADSPEPG